MWDMHHLEQRHPNRHCRVCHCRVCHCGCYGKIWVVEWDWLPFRTGNGIKTSVYIYTHVHKRMNTLDNMEREVDMLCRLIEESQKEASTLLSYAGAVTANSSSNHATSMSAIGSSKKWSPAYTPVNSNPWGPPLPPSVGLDSKVWRPSVMERSMERSTISLDVKTFLSPIV